MKKNALKYCCLIFTIIISLVIYSCRKDSRYVDISDLNDPKAPLNIASAEEYYHQLVQTNGDTVGNRNLSTQSIGSIAKQNKKYVMFNKASFGATSSYTFVEAALRYNRRSSATVVANNAPGDRNQQIQQLNSSFDRLFIYKDKKTGKISQRIITYMPDADYLKRHHNDISNNTLNNLDGDFNGYIKFKTWNGKELSLLKVRNGKGVKRMFPGTLSKRISGLNSVNGLKTTSTEVCADLYLYTYTQNCWYSGPENSIEECGDWELTNQEYVETDCYTISDPNDPCNDPLNTECNPDPDPNQDAGCEAPASDFTDDDTLVSIENGAASTDPNIRNKLYTWTFFTINSQGLSWQSLESGSHHYTGSQWEWTSLSHVNSTMVGTSGGNTTYSLAVLSSTANYPLPTLATMALAYQVTIATTCKDKTTNTDRTTTSNLPIMQKSKSFTSN